MQATLYVLAVQCICTYIRIDTARESSPWCVCNNNAAMHWQVQSIRDALFAYLAVCHSYLTRGSGLDGRMADDWAWCEKQGKNVLCVHLKWMSERITLWKGTSRQTVTLRTTEAHSDMSKNRYSSKATMPTDSSPESEERKLIPDIDCHSMATESGRDTCRNTLLISGRTWKNAYEYPSDSDKT